MKYCIAIIMDKLKINCLFDYEKTFCSDDIKRTRYIPMLETILRLINSYNRGSVFDIEDKLIQKIKLFENFGMCLNNQGQEYVKKKFGKKYAFLSDNGSHSPNIAILLPDVLQNESKANISFSLDFDKGIITAPIFSAVDQETFVNSFYKEKTLYDFSKLDKLEMDPDNIMFYEFDEFCKFMQKNQYKPFLVAKDDNLVAFTTENMDKLMY